MKLKHKIKLLLLALVLITVTSCSSYFSAGMSGTVIDEETGEGIANVLVCAYTDENARNTAYNSYDYNYDTKFLGNNAIFRTYTDANGAFSIKSIKWNTTSPTYGKDGDNKTIYPLYYHEDYGLVRGDLITITSDSINEGVNQKLEKQRETRTINIRVIHPTRNTDYTSEYTFELCEEKGFVYEQEDPDVQITQVNDTTFNISYKKDCDIPELTISKFKNKSNLEAGMQNTKPCKYDLSFYETMDLPWNIDFDPDVSTYYFYAKPIRFSYPIISGRIGSSTTENPSEINNSIIYGTDSDNGLEVYCTYSNTNMEKVLIGSTVTTKKKIEGSNPAIITNGTFTIDLQEYSYIDKDYTGEFSGEKTIEINFPGEDGGLNTKTITFTSATDTIEDIFCNRTIRTESEPQT